MNSFKHVYIVIAISLLPLISLFTTSAMPHTHDGPVHLARMAAYYKALMGGQILPRWASDLNYSYGMPLFNFIYHTPYLVSSFFLLLGLGLVLTFKLVLAVSYILAAIGSFILGKEIFKDNRKALLFAIFYQFAPFRFVEMSIRGSFGEIYTYALLPFVLWGILKLAKSMKYRYFAITAISIAFLILSHNSISLAFFIFASGFVIVLDAPINKKILSLAALILGLALSTAYWLPALLEHKYTYGDLFMKDMYKTHFAPLLNFLLPNFTNASSMQTGGIDTQIGIFHVAALFLALYAIIAKKYPGYIKQNLTIYLLAVSGITLFFMQPISIFFWQTTAILRQFQFPWRLLSVFIVTTSFLSLYYFEFKWISKPIGYSLIIVSVVASTIFFWKPPLGFDSIDENYYWNYPLNTTFFGETDLIWSAGMAKGYPTSQMQIISGEATLSDIKRFSTIHMAVVNAKTPTRLVDNTQYFPGWRVYVDRQNTQIQFQDPTWRGLVTFDVTAGIHKIKVSFQKSGVEKISEVISFLSVVILFSTPIILKKKYFYEKK